MQKKAPPKNLLIGFRALTEAILAGKEIDKVLLKKGLQGEQYHELMRTLRERSIPWQSVPEEKLQSLTRSNHQGVVAFTAAVAFQPMEEVVARLFETGVDPMILLLDGVTDVRNFGSMCRTAESLGVQAVVVPEKGSAAVNEDAVKTSTGALFNIELCRVKSLAQAVSYLQSAGVRVVACSEKGADKVFAVPLTGPLAVVMGAEDEGISSEVMRKVDHIARIPMMGKTASMNVGVACGIILYEALRQKMT
jgi:23S rRNA (guanosine2251-2'-O)-methyltransferase